MCLYELVKSISAELLEAPYPPRLLSSKYIKYHEFSNLISSPFHRLTGSHSCGILRMLLIIVQWRIHVRLLVPRDHGRRCSGSRTSGMCDALSAQVQVWAEAERQLRPLREEHPRICRDCCPGCFSEHCGSVRYVPYPVTSQKTFPGNTIFNAENRS